jgi:hypothetical protein
MKKRALAVAALGLLLPLAAACSSADSTGDLKKSDLKEELVKNGLTDKQADCTADALIDADFTKGELDKMNGGKQDEVDKNKVKAFNAAVAKCATGTTGG